MSNVPTKPSLVRVGFIGLGAMGLPMARRVVASGHETVTATHRRREPADELAALGARVVETPAEVARNADVVITIVPADAELREVVLGAHGLIHELTDGKVLIDMTTATPLVVHEIEAAVAKFGVRVLDAPVSGGTAAAAEGTLTIMVGGDADLLERHRPLLEVMGRNVVHVGAVGQGKVVKMVNQVMAAVHLLAMGEAFALGVKCGADPQVLYDVIKTSSGYSRMMDLRLKDFLLADAFAPGFRLDLMKKDLRLAVESAQALGLPLFFGSAAAQIFQAASVAGEGGRDFSAAAKYLADLAGVRLCRHDGRRS
jgi:3-hydroxyisobutyrate dehydrogenase-like beta-hydroxyacid dehydrogenase